MKSFKNRILLIIVLLGLTSFGYAATLGGLQESLATFLGIQTPAVETAEAPAPFFVTTVSTNGGSGLAATYPDLASAITALNAATITSPVVITVSGTETAPAGGYNITATGTVTNTITINGGGGATTTITAFSPQVTGSAASSFDAIFKIVGGDYITIQGFTMQENAGNTVITPGTTNTMTEFGVLLVHTSATDGAQNNTIQNNIIALNSTYTNSVGIFSTSSSSSANATLAATSTAGTNSNNKIYGNTISNTAYGIWFICEPVTSAINESGNDIGGTTLSTGNTITFGNATASSGVWNRSTSTLQAGINMRNGVGNIRFNTVTSNSAAYVGSAGLNGVLVGSNTAPTTTYTSTISDNTVTLTTTGLALVSGIDFGVGTSIGTIVGSTNNVTLNQNATAANSAAATGIKANYTAATITTNGNTVTINQTQNTAGALSSTTLGINLSGAATTINALSNTIVVNQTTSVASGITTTIKGIQATTASTTVNIGSSGNANNITIKQAQTGSGTYGSGAITYIDVNATHATANVKSNNLLTTGSTIRSTGTLIGVFQDSTVTVLVDISNNTMNVDRVAASGAASFQTTSSTPSENADTLTGNNITFTNLSGTSSVTGISAGGGNGFPKNISSNTISISGTHTGASVGILSNFTGTGTYNSNSITISSASASVTGMSVSGSSSTNSMSSNTVSLTSSSTAPTAMIGLTIASGTGAHSVTNNTFSALNFTGIITTTPAVSGIVMSAGTAASISGNTITNISAGAATSTSSATVDGILLSGATSVNVFKNKIHGLTTAATGSSTVVNGIRISAGTTNTVFNNIIGNLTAGASTNTDSIRGIGITSTTTSSTNNIYYNTIFLSGSGGTNFGSSGIFHAASATSTTATLNLRNNIIVNTAVPNGTGLTVAYRRSAGTAGQLANYASTSNNNDFYAGTPGAANLIYSDGSSTAQTMTAYKAGAFTAGTIAPRDSLSFTENPPFLSTVGSSANFLHINTTIATQTESGAVNIGGITDDFDAQTRQGNGGYSGTGTAPDVGADEFEGIPQDLTAPAISYTPFGNGAAVATRNVTGVTITDATGVNTTAGTKPRLYYKKSGDTNDLAATGWKFVEANGTTSPFDFTINYASLNAGSVSVTDVIQYFVVAQDTAAPTVGINSGTFAAQPTSVALTGTAFPIGGTINSYTISPAITGTKTVCASGCDYPTLTGSTGIFNAINNSIATGNISVEIGGPLTVETGAVALNAIAEEPSGSNFTVKIYPTGTTRTISGGLASNGLVRLNGADRVTIDGSIGGTGTDRSLTITNTSTTSPTAVSLVSIGTGAGAVSNTIKNCNISTGVSAATGYGIAVGGSTPGTSGADNDSVTIQNNSVTVATIGIYANGTASVTSGGDDSLAITGNTIDYNGTIASIGIEAGNALNSSVSQNTVSEQTSATQSPTAISLETGFVSSSVTGNTISKSLTTNTSGYGGRGITVGTGTASSALTLSNNVIYAVNGSDFSGFSNSSSMGIAIGMIGNSSTISTTAGGINLYFNSVRMTGTIGSNSTSAITTALYVGSGASALDLRNNIFANTMTGISTTQKNYAIYSAAANTAFTTINYNDYYVTNSFNAASAIPGFLTSDRTDLAGIQAGFGQNTNSTIANPLFNSNTNLQPQTGSPMVGAGITGTGITTDILGVTRNNPPTIGAYENALDTVGPVITYTAFGNTTSTADRTLSITVTDTSGVPTAGAGLPVIYYKKNAGSYVNSQCSFVSGSSYNCPVVSASMGGVATSDTISYYVAAQDSVNNVSTNPATGASGFTANPPAASTPPTTPNSYVISIVYSGPLTVDSAGAITSLTNAGGLFDKLNQGVLSGDLNVSITSDLTAETGAIALNQIVEQGAGGYTVTIKPSGVAHAVSGTVASNTMIRLNGANRVVFDGSLTVGGTDRSLSFENLSTTTPGVFRLGSIGSTPIVNDTIKNCTIRNGVNTSSAITVLDTAGSVAGFFNNITIQNNDVQKAFRGIFVNASVTGTNGSGTLITGNSLNTAGANSIRLNPIFVAGANGVTISNNTMGNISDSNAEVPVGIVLSTGTDNAIVTGNTISSIVSTSATTTASASGINIGAGAAVTSITVSNNNISTLTAAGTSLSFFGIASFSPNVAITNNTISGMTLSGATSGWGIVLAGVTNNTVNGNTVSAMSISGTSSVTSGIQVQGASTNVTIEKNKVFNIKNTSTSGYGANGIQLGSSSTTANTTAKNNFVYDVAAFGFAGPDVADNGYGMIVTSGAGYNIYNNSVHMNTNQTATTGLPAAFNVLTAVTTAGAINLRNNIFANSQTVGTERYAIYSGAANTVFSAIDFNDYFTAGPDLGFIGVNRADLTAIQAGFGGNTASIPTNPLFTLATNLHIAPGSPARNAGTTIAAVTNDFDGDLRPQESVYDIGADEYVDAIAPDTTINSNPPNPSNSSSAAFTFSGTDARPAPAKSAETGDSLAPEVVASFECQLDGGSFATCTSPQNYSGLSDGSHNFQVRAKDAGGNVDPSPASYTWVIDTIAPDTTITTFPSNPTNSNSATFNFTGNDGAGTGIAGFVCQIDGGSFSPCATGVTYPGLSNGSHNFQVAAVDGAGNTDGSPAGYTWVIDTIEPDTSLLSTPTNPTNSASATFTFSGSDPGGTGVASFECDLDGGGFTTCSSGVNYPSLSDGSHTFQVRARDGANNTDSSPAGFTWVIDTTAPDTSILTSPSNPTNSNSATFTFSGSDGSGTGVASFECDLDGGGYATCTSGINYPSLSDGSHTFQVRAKDAVNNTDASPASFTWVIDTVGPDTTILTSPSNPSNSSSATFTFSGTDARHAPKKSADTRDSFAPESVASFECQLDGGGFAACTSPQNYSGLSEGSHTFQVRTKDAGGNVDTTPASYTWVIDTIAPDTTITTSPSNPTNSNSATFNFTGNDGAGTGIAGFICQIDGGGFSPCATGVTYSSLSDGSHNFQVAAVDGAGNTDASPASFTWIVDTIAPDTSILTSPPNPSNSSSASFTFSGSDPGGTGVASFECQLDGGGFTTCTSGINYPSLSDGSHTFQVRAKDGANNTDASPASYTWTIDAAQPDTTIDSNPSNPTNSASATFTFSGTDGSGTGVASFECDLDGGGFTTCTSPQNYPTLSDGSHTFQVRAIDGAGNTDSSPASYTWVIDTAAPDTTIDSNPSNPSNSSSATFTFSGSDSLANVKQQGGKPQVVSLTFECQLDGSGFAPCTSGVNYPGLSDGSHTFQVRAKDAVNNTDASPASFTWVIDTTPPDTSILTNPSNPTNSSSATFTFSGSDGSGTGVTSFDCQIDGGGFTPCTSGVNYPGLSDGSHTFQVRAKDAVNNTDASPAGFTWIIDTIAPDTSILTNPSNPTNSASATFTFSGSDGSGTGVAGFDCQIDGGGFTPCTSGVNYPGLSDGSHTFQVRAKDAVNNTDASPAGFTWIIDTIAPDTSILTNPSNPTNSASATFTFSGSDGSGTGVAGFDCQIDGGGFTPCTSGVNYPGLSNGSHTFDVRAKDGVNNIDASPASYTWTIDTIAPQTTIDSNPSNPTSSSSATFTFSGSDSLVASRQKDKQLSVTLTFECQLDSGGFAPCTSGVNYPGLSDGSHTFQVRAKDTAGNTDPSPASFTWVVDTTAPDTSITVNPGGITNSTSASFSFTGNDGSGVGVASFECEFDFGSYAPCVSGVTYNSLSEGAHNFRVRAKDGVGNTDPIPAGWAWTVDLTPPVIANYAPLPNTASTAARVQTVTVTDNFATNTVTLNYSVNGGAFTPVACISPSFNTWDCTIPGQPLSTAVAYYVTAKDVATNNAAPNPSAGTPNLYSVGAATVPAGTYNYVSLSSGAALGGNVTVVNTFDLGGIVDTGANTLTLGCSATVTGAGAASYVVGNVQKDFCGTGTFVYPIGTTPNGAARGNDNELVPEVVGEYSPATITINSGTFPSSLTINIQDTWLPGLGQTNSLSRYWEVTETGALNANMTFQYLNEDVYGIEALYQVFKRESGFTIPQPGSVNAGANTFTATNVTNFSGWGAGVLAPTAASADIGGRVLTAGGMPIANVKVKIAGGGLPETIVTYTGTLGYYNFTDLPVGQNYVVTVKSRRFTFSNPSHLITLIDNITDGDFIADPQE